MRRIVYLLLLPGCARTVRDDLADLRAERSRLEERLRVSEHSPIWVSEGDHAFERFLRDDDSEIPSFIYDHVLRKLAAQGDSAIRAATREGFDPAACLASPASFRGAFWRVSGMISRFWIQKIADPDCPASQVYAGVFYPDYGDPVFFHLLEKPDILELGADTVEIDGLFLKVVTFRSPGGRVLTAPFFMAKTLRRLM